jgi:acyl-CoA synthetase (AMP-forming)/AMP-acid ligase II
MAFDYGTLRDLWYRDGWFSSRTCIDALEDGARKHDSMPVHFVSAAAVTAVTVGDIHRAAATFAGALQQLGVRPGDTVAVQLTNRVECAVAYQGVLLSGAVLVPIVHIYGIAEVRFILEDSCAKVLVTDARLPSSDLALSGSSYAVPAGPHHVVVDAEPGEGYLAWSQLTTSAVYRRPEVESDDICLLVYTSGTTSAPKGVQHTHNTVLAEQSSMPALIAAAPDDVSLASFPPGHIAGLGGMLRALVSGSRTVFLERWSPARAVELIREFSVTSMAGAPTHLNDILELACAKGELDTLREFLVGAAPVSPELGRRAVEAGIETFRSYGSTEHPTVTGEHAGDSAWGRMNTDGKPLPGSVVRILASDGRDAAVGQEGEVVVRGPEQFIGYRDRALNDEAFTVDGWFRTGDLGRLDADGRLTITDRIKDVIVRGGETISSSQVEEAVATHPAVAEVAALGAPDSRFGEVVAVVVVLRPHATLDLAEIRHHLDQAGLARQKAPEVLKIARSLPRTALGKVKKADLRATFFPESRGI